MIASIRQRLFDHLFWNEEIHKEEQHSSHETCQFSFVSSGRFYTSKHVSSRLSRLTGLNIVELGSFEELNTIVLKKILIDCRSICSLIFVCERIKKQHAASRRNPGVLSQELRTDPTECFSELGNDEL